MNRIIGGCTIAVKIAGLPHHQHRGKAADHVQRSEHMGEFLAAAGVEREADRGRGDGDQHGAPPGHTRHVGMDGPTLRAHR